MKKVFVDTNVLIYAYSEDEPEKAVVSQKIIVENNSITSVQVLNELSNVLYKKFRKSEDEVVSVILEITELLEVVPVTLSTVLKAHEVKRRYRYSYYDSLIIASALENNCEILYTEDMQHNQKISENLHIVNPFRGESKYL
ncbi:PIN domain-containing protein [Desulfurobacterium atlanticum]|uniref:Predicted nucleic acid-binding protein, contains PIN domain n=1 Tax=Desulfurobacterium atlanticum TaxID=240169 RepID=A0A238YEI9_9BACT|nr:PIN domain-containing protein [Desulfurobacterium atlanticum]SNR69004.1 Predicted nucleic acid-binding protein, contains PIN domain [Desulfurobacterium atlanticum]